jgi:methionine aminopeptidase
MRRAGLVVWGAHQLAASLVRPGVTTGEIDGAIERFFEEQGAVSLFKGVPGKVPFPAVCCISVNDEVVHGIPVSIASITSLIAMKTKSGRKQDMEDVRALTIILNQKSGKK